MCVQANLAVQDLCHDHMPICHIFFIFFFFNDTATTEIYTLSLHDALPIFARGNRGQDRGRDRDQCARGGDGAAVARRSEEHTSELQSRQYLVCRLLLEKKKKYRKLQVEQFVAGYDLVIAQEIMV